MGPENSPPLAGWLLSQAPAVRLLLELRSRWWPVARHGGLFMDRVARPQGSVSKTVKKGAGLLGPLLCHYKVLHLQAPTLARAPTPASAASAPGTTRTRVQSAVSHRATPARTVGPNSVSS